MTARFEGAGGLVEKFPDEALADSPTGLAAWIATAPGLHPLWSQYLLSVVSLKDVPGAAEPVLQRPGMTHEVTVFVLNPDWGPYEPVRFRGIRVLEPVNVVEQFAATNEEAVHLLELCARAVADGLLNPETTASDTLKLVWRDAIATTLDHGKGHDGPGA